MRGACAGRKDRYEAFLQEVCARTARLVAHWQAVGFVHGVCNTDNFSILGETIDYGCARLEHIRCWARVTVDQ